MGRMIFDLTDEDREALEAIRKREGYRSHAETLRQLIRLDAARPAQEDQFTRSFHEHLGRGVSEMLTRPVLPVMKRKAFNPQPKKGK